MYTSSSLTIRPAALADAAVIHRLADEAFPATYRNILTQAQIAYMMEWMYSLESLERQMTVEGHRYYIAYADGEAVGYVSIQQEEADLFHLQKIYVLPSWQGRGVGSRLFAHALAAIRALHPKACRMELNVNRDNSAREFYERQGMKIVRVGDFDIGGGYFMNDYIMGLDLPGDDDRQKDAAFSNYQI
jgi:ribosomal protein S18 acetylase RimI-like enzyme